MNRYFQPADPKWFGGTSLGIAYTSNIHGLSPNDMTIISVNQNSVWEREISYAIPAGLPPCPPEGCICSWNWIHRANNGEGYPFEIVSKPVHGSADIKVQFAVPVPDHWTDKRGQHGAARGCAP